MDIRIHYQNVNFRVSESAKIKKWIESAIGDEGKIGVRIDYYFIDNRSQREINAEFLEHHYNTDVITFDYSEKEQISGEIYIAIDTVRENSKRFGTKFRTEYLRVMIHGILHLLGYDDKTEEEQEEIRNKENQYLNNY